MDGSFADVNGAHLRYEVQGEGRPLVLIHSALGHLGMWDEQVEAFSQRWRFIRYDVRGFGESTGPEGSYTDYEDLAALLDFLGVEQADLLGCSSGGGIAIVFTLAFPGRVGSLVLVGPALSGTHPEPDELIDPLRAAMLAAYQRRDLEQAAELTARIWVVGPRRSASEVDPGYRARALELIRYTLALPDRSEPRELEPPAAGRLGEIRAPTLVMVGDEDTDWMQKVTGKIAREIPGAKRVVLPGAAHLPSMEHPAEFNRIVMEFLG